LCCLVALCSLLRSLGRSKRKTARRSKTPRPSCCHCFLQFVAWAPPAFLPSRIWWDTRPRFWHCCSLLVCDVPPGLLPWCAFVALPSSSASVFFPRFSSGRRRPASWVAAPSVGSPCPSPWVLSLIGWRVSPSFALARLDYPGLPRPPSLGTLWAFLPPSWGDLSRPKVAVPLVVWEADGTRPVNPRVGSILNRWPTGLSMFGPPGGALIWPPGNWGPKPSCSSQGNSYFEGITVTILPRRGILYYSGFTGTKVTGLPLCDRRKLPGDEHWENRLPGPAVKAPRPPTRPKGARPPAWRGPRFPKWSPPPWLQPGRAQFLVFPGMETLGLILSTGGPGWK